MGQIGHGCATTAHAVRAAIQRSQASTAELSREVGINPKTVAKGRKRQSVEDLKTGPKEPRSTVLSEEEEAIVVTFPRHTLLPLDDCLYALQPTATGSRHLPNASHAVFSAQMPSAMSHWSAIGPSDNGECISRLPDMDGDTPKKQRLKRRAIEGAIGSSPMASRSASSTSTSPSSGRPKARVRHGPRTDGGIMATLVVAVDRTSRFAVAQLVEKADRKTAWEVLERLLDAAPYRIHTSLTDNGIQFAEQPRNRTAILSRPMRFDMICEANGIEHRLTEPNHPWTNGQVERMNRTIENATVKRHHYDGHAQLRSHLADVLDAYTFARRLKTLSGLTPYDCICKIWTSETDRPIVDPIHQMPGLNS